MDMGGSKSVYLCLWPSDVASGVLLEVRWVRRRAMGEGKAEKRLIAIPTLTLDELLRTDHHDDGSRSKPGYKRIRGVEWR